MPVLRLNVFFPPRLRLALGRWPFRFTESPNQHPLKGKKSSATIGWSVKTWFLTDQTPAYDSLLHHDVHILLPLICNNDLFLLDDKNV